MTSSEEVIDKRYRHFIILLYPEWDNYSDILQDLIGSFKNYAYITHQPEVEEKKEHTHLILSLDNPRTIDSLSKRLDIPQNLIKNCKSLRGACRYLIHIDNEDKKQYELTEVKVSNSFKGTFYKSFDDLESDEQILSNIYDYINTYSKEYDATILELKLSMYVCSAGYERVFKRYYNTITKVIYYKTC